MNEQTNKQKTQTFSSTHRGLLSLLNRIENLCIIGRRVKFRLLVKQKFYGSKKKKKKGWERGLNSEVGM